VKRKSSFGGFLGAAAILVAAAGFCSLVWLSQPSATTDSTGGFDMTVIVSDSLPVSSTSAPAVQLDYVATNVLAQ